MTEPTTPAGRALLDHIERLDYDAYDAGRAAFGSWETALATIEEQARAEGRREADALLRQVGEALVAVHTASNEDDVPFVDLMGRDLFGIVTEAVAAYSSRDVKGYDDAETAAPQPLDMERLAEAGGNVLDGRRIGSVRLYRNTITSDDWVAIAAEYERLGQDG